MVSRFAWCPATHHFSRGEPTQPREQVQPGELTILASLRPTEIATKDTAVPTSGRRLALARSLTDGKHPLTTRVLVNRVWHHHFGRGLVASVADFGHLGERPTHPELLDWLASEFVAQGWSLKKLHRLIVTSAAYRQSSARDPQKERLDPDNRLLGRMNVRRLEAVTIRDAMLVVSGKMNRRMFGAPVPVRVDEDGLVVVGVDTNDTAGRPTGKYVALNGDEFRRSLYTQNRRTRPLGILETFDMPRMEPNCEARNASTVAPQSLAMMNGEFALAQSKFFAERVVREAGPDGAAQVKRAWLLAFGSEAPTAKAREAAEFLKEQTAHFAVHPVKPPTVAKGKEAPAATPETQASRPSAKPCSRRINFCMSIDSIAGLRAPTAFVASVYDRRKLPRAKAVRSHPLAAYALKSATVIDRRDKRCVTAPPLRAARATICRVAAGGRRP
jgi:hypothetical protein